jgi:hypothetical protein
MRRIWLAWGQSALLCAHPSSADLLNHERHGNPAVGTGVKVVWLVPKKDPTKDNTRLPAS